MPMLKLQTRSLCCKPDVTSLEKENKIRRGWNAPKRKENTGGTKREPNGIKMGVKIAFNRDQLSRDNRCQKHKKIANTKRRQRLDLFVTVFIHLEVDLYCKIP